MEQILHTSVFWIARLAEAVAALVIAYAILEAVFRLVFPSQSTLPARLRDRQRVVFLRFARWLILALEFTLAGDLVQTAAAPTWDAIGQLAAIAAIRTFLNFFLERDLERFGEFPMEAQGAGAAAPAHSGSPPRRHG